MSYKPNTPNYRTNIKKFRDFKSEEELEDETRDYTSNHVDTKRHMGNYKMKFDHTTGKVINRTLGEVKDELDKLRKSKDNE